MHGNLLLMIRAIVASAAIIAIAALASPARAIAPHPLQLVDQTGKIFTIPALRGRPLIVTFVAAHCTDACPLINAQFAQAAQLLQQSHMQARLLTITLDPENDPPSVMRQLARRFGADPRQWIVASGSVANVHSIMKLFGVQAERGPKGYAEMHTTFVYIFDKHERLRKTILASTMLGAQLADDVRTQWRTLVQ